MYGTDNFLQIYVILTVLLVMALGVAIIIIIDHKARIPGDFVKHPFAIIGSRHDHPLISFLTTTILLGIILFLVLELAIVLYERIDPFNTQKQQSELLRKLHEQRFTERMRHFHNEPEQNLVDLGKKQACFYCHGDYPHSKKRMVRSLLNMHTQFIGCMTCHVDDNKIPEDNYQFRWLNYSGIPVSGPPYGSSHDPETGFLVKTDDLYSKIVVYTTEDGKERLLELTEDDTEIQEFAALVSDGKLTDEDREGLKRRFHTLIRDKGRKCSACHTHTEKGYLPLQDLGFSVQRVSDLTNLNIIGVVEKYLDFYLPDLMKGSVQYPDTSAYDNVANEAAPVEENEAIQTGSKEISSRD